MSHRRPRPFLRALLAGLGYALLFGIACRWPHDWTAMLAWIAPAPLIACAIGTRFNWRAALGVYLGVIPFWAYWHHWVWTNDVSRLGFVLMTLYLALWAPAFCAIVATIRARLGIAAAIAAIPLAWTALEYLRGEVFFYGYPWFLLAHPAIESDTARRLASLVGVYMVGFVHMTAWAVFAAAMAWARLRDRRTAIPALAFSGAAFALIPVLAALIPLPPANTRASARIAVIQTNVDQSNRRAWSIEQRVADFNRFTQLTLRAADAEPDLIVWPETMYPGFFGLTAPARAEIERANIGIERFPRTLLQLQEWVGAPMLVGAVAVENLKLEVLPNGDVRDHVDATYNSAYLLADGAVTDQRYDKLRLTPFGEVLPYAEWWDWLEQLVMGVGARGMSFSISRGQQPRLIHVPTPEGPPLRVATPICFEATMPRLCRRLAHHADGAHMLVNLTNDGWFGDFDPGRRTHLTLARWRAAELGIPMVRAANTGISAAIAADGRVLALGPNLDLPAAPAREDGVMLCDVAYNPQRRPTLYASLGEWPAAGCVVLAAGMLMLAFARPRDSRTSPVSQSAELASR